MENGKDICAEDRSTDEVKKMSTAPKPTAKGNEKISILKHEVYRKSGEAGEARPDGVEITVKNVTASNIDAAIFEAVFYGIDGNILDTVEHKTLELTPGKERKIRIAFSEGSKDKIESYYIKVLKILTPPAPVIIGNEKIEILKHKISGYLKMESKDFPNCVEFSIKNTSGKTIATARLEIRFYDIEGKELEKVEKTVLDLKANACRAINADCRVMGYNIVKSYSIKVIRVVTADFEKVQVRRRERSINEAGEEEIKGTIKNISEVKTDAALVAQYFDLTQEIIGTSVLPIRDIEPNETRQFVLKYRPHEGDKIAKYDLTVGEIV